MGKYTLEVALQNLPTNPYNPCNPCNIHPLSGITNLKMVRLVKIFRIVRVFRKSKAANRIITALVAGLVPGKRDLVERQKRPSREAKEN